jgi:CBS domain-containing protein
MADLSDLPESIRKTPIKEFMLQNVPQVQLNDPLLDAVEKYKKSLYPALLVVNPATGGSLAGMITDNDLVGITGPVSVGSVLPKDPVIAIRENATLSELLEILNGINTQKRLLDRVPVLDQQDRPLGVIDRDKLTIRLGEMLAAELVKK